MIRNNNTPDDPSHHVEIIARVSCREDVVEIDPPLCREKSQGVTF
jgi:hypothetical protein